MRIKDLKEYQKIPPRAGGEFPDIKNLTYIGDLGTSIGTLKVYGQASEIEEFFGVAIDETIKAGFTIVKTGYGFYMADRAYADPSIQNKGILSNLLIFVTKQGYKILSHTQLTDTGEKLWRSVSRKYNHAVIINLETKKKYLVSDIGKIVDGVKIPNPADDNTAANIYNKKSKSEQRWFYLLESEKEIISEWQILQPVCWFTDGE